MGEGFVKLGINKDIIKGLEGLGYFSPTQVQEEVVPIALNKRDVLVKAKTGSGKTAAFGIPICQMIDSKIKTPQALVLSPTRELALQIKEEIDGIGRFRNLKSSAICGKLSIDVQKKQLQQGVHVIVGTSGRTLELIEKRNINLGNIKYLVIDEVDEMLSLGFIKEVEAIIEKLPKNRVTMFFSATISDKVKKLSEKYMKKPDFIEVEIENSSAQLIQQFYYEIQETEKFNILNAIIYTQIPEKCIIFCNTREAVDELVKKMKVNKYLCEGIHGAMEQKNRINAINRFKRGEFYFLVATDVAGRGIHVDDISHVINYDIPFDKVNYIHRIGRTGRHNSEGIAITLVDNEEMKKLIEIEKFIGYDIPKGEIPKMKNKIKMKK